MKVIAGLSVNQMHANVPALNDASEPKAGFGFEEEVVVITLFFFLLFAHDCSSLSGI